VRRHLVQLHHSPALLALRIGDDPLQLHPRRAIGARRRPHLAGHGEIRVRGGILHQIAEVGQPGQHLLRQRAVAIAGRPRHAGEIQLGRPVHQAVRVALLPRGLDVAQQRLDRWRLAFRRGLERRGRAFGPKLGGDGRSLRRALRDAGRVLDRVGRHHIRPARLGPQHQPPPDGPTGARDRWNLLGLERHRRRVHPEAGRAVGQQRLGGNRDRQPGRRRLGQPAADGAGVAQQRLRQVAAPGEQQQDDNHQVGHATTDIWCPIGPPPASVRRRWLKKHASSGSVSAAITCTSAPAARRRAAQ